MIRVSQPTWGDCWCSCKRYCCWNLQRGSWRRKQIVQELQTVQSIVKSTKRFMKKKANCPDIRVNRHEQNEKKRPWQYHLWTKQGKKLYWSKEKNCKKVFAVLSYQVYSTAQPRLSRSFHNNKNCIKTRWRNGFPTTKGTLKRQLQPKPQGQHVNLDNAKENLRGPKRRTARQSWLCWAARCIAFCPAMWTSFNCPMLFPLF